VLTDYSKLERDQRNILRLMLGSNRIRVAAEENWERIARFVVGTFRADAARAEAGAEILDRVEELSRIGPDFSRL
jgi:hypothetical protein